MPSQHHPAPPDVESLASLFYATPEDLGDFREVSPAEMPAIAAKLLNHDHHMTVTVERHHGCAVDVRVLDRIATKTSYSRKILLTRQSDGAVVQFGLVRIGLNCVDDAVRQEIERESIPLGRILISHGVLRQVRLAALFRILPGPALCREMKLKTPLEIYGRTATIDVNGAPAIELLEILAPCSVGCG